MSIENDVEFIDEQIIWAQLDKMKCTQKRKIVFFSLWLAVLDAIQWKRENDSSKTFHTILEFRKFRNLFLSVSFYLAHHPSFCLFTFHVVVLPGDTGHAVVEPNAKYVLSWAQQKLGDVKIKCETKATEAEDRREYQAQRNGAFFTS